MMQPSAFTTEGVYIDPLMSPFFENLLGSLTIFHMNLILLLIMTMNVNHKGSVPLRPGEKIRNSKIKILFIVWSYCVLQRFNSYVKNI